jgi:hypothetical protein
MESTISSTDTPSAFTRHRAFDRPQRCRCAFPHIGTTGTFVPSDALRLRKKSEGSRSMAAYLIAILMFIATFIIAFLFAGSDRSANATSPLSLAVLFLGSMMSASVIGMHLFAH